MIYRRFGRTGLRMPVLSFGCMRSMQSWQDVSPAEISDSSQSNLQAIVDAALGHGINHIETAHGYGSSEQQLGLILPQLDRSAYILQTKVVPGQNPEEFVAKVKTSLQRLRVDRLDLLGLHGINDHRSLWHCCRKHGCLEAARKLQDQGLVDHIGFSAHGPAEVILEALSFTEYGGFDYANLHWYYILDANRRAVEYAADNDIGVFIISPNDKGGQLHTPPRKLQRLCEPFSPMLFNDLYCLDQPGVCTISVGASLPHHFDEHLKVLDWLAHSDRKAFFTADRRLKQEMRKATGFDRPDHLWDALPGWDAFPGNINARMVVWLVNLYRAWGMKRYAKERYAMLNRGSTWVPGNDGARAEALDLSEISLPETFTPDRLRQMLTKAHALLRKEGEPRS